MNDEEKKSYIDYVNNFMYDHGFFNTFNDKPVEKLYVYDLIQSAIKQGRADYEVECQKRYCAYVGKDCIIGNLVEEDAYQQGRADQLKEDTPYFATNIDDKTEAKIRADALNALIANINKKKFSFRNTNLVFMGDVLATAQELLQGSE